ncbi:NtaA/DmoA family FMN-dependent monooxygenase [Pseudomonas fluorescens]|uniref:NtaA/DmoA family FMN-dependent monooxygenase n=1 Tax=Pseudomonas fluorescens TaxID=294 RepID=UPI000CA3580C|nr:NtaA/DmoA family FMN-dependent monooxygenase [Pseudomonas fluorescens]AUM70541.1 LLM class flavin-dependent oxidoreductase [Pseudomonas fluorescens]
MSRNNMSLSLFFFNPQGDYRFSWRHPDAPEQEIFGLPFYVKLVQQAEAAKFDAVFIADHVAVWDAATSGLKHYANARLEPLTLISALSAVTQSIGLMATASTSYNEPYNLARYFASLDHLSNGRVAWNIVTSWLEEEAANYSAMGMAKHSDRYARATEFITVTKRLWDSWEDDALLFDKATGAFAAPEKIHTLNHVGEEFSVRGPLNVPRSPQGYPVLAQAGSSEAGKNLAAAHADFHFCLLKTVEEGLAYRADFNRRLASKGRLPSDLKIIAGVLPVVLVDETEADRRQALVDNLIIDELAIDLVSSYTRIDLSGLSPDEPLPPLPDSVDFDGIRTELELIRQYDSTLTIRELGRRLVNSSNTWLVIGTAEHVAAQLSELYEAGAVDGYNLMFPLLPNDFDRFTESVVPLLQARGVFRKEYEPGTLRDRLGLKRPPNSFLNQAAD